MVVVGCGWGVMVGVVVGIPDHATYYYLHTVLWESFGRARERASVGREEKKKKKRKRGSTRGSTVQYILSSAPVPAQ